jgi:hypothetical protein
MPVLDLGSVDSDHPTLQIGERLEPSIEEMVSPKEQVLALQQLEYVTSHEVFALDSTESIQCEKSPPPPPPASSPFSWVCDSSPASIFC